MRNTAMVTGANGHLGNNLIRTLLDKEKGNRVIAGIRNPATRAALAGLDCTVAHIDLLDKHSLAKGMAGVDILYQVGAVFKHWTKDPEREIYRANLQGTRNVLEAAAESGVRRIVYVSSVAAVDRAQTPIDETSWNPSKANVYFRSKTDSEKLAWTLAGDLGLDVVSVLPSAMIGENCFRTTPTMSLFETVLDGKLTADPGFFLNFIDVADVAEACWRAATHGRAGERYLLANENATSTGEVVRLIQREFPDRGIKTPAKPPRWLLRLIVTLMEGMSRVSGTEPQLQSNFLTEFTVRETCDISKARRELGFDPKPPEEAIIKALRYIAARD